MGLLGRIKGLEGFAAIATFGGPSCGTLRGMTPDYVGRTREDSRSLQAVTAPKHPTDGLDDVDEALLVALAADGRAGYEALARTLGLPRANVRARMHRLLDSGAVVISGVVHPSVFGLGAYAHVSVGCTGPAAPVADRMAELEDVPLVSLTSGRRPIIAEVRTRDQESLAGVLAEIGALPGVVSTDCSLYLDILQGANVPPRPSLERTLDEVDRGLLTALQADGRRTFADLGEDVGLSTGAARMRVLRLLGAGVVEIRVRLLPGVRGESQTGIGVRLDGRRTDALAALRALRSVHYLATALGRWDVIGTVHAGPEEAEWSVLDAVRAVPGVVQVESWRHLRFVKERYDVSTCQ
jgi:DNA-binding Lrp family transcriptional regulator